MSQVVDQLKKCENALVVYLFRDHPGKQFLFFLFVLVNTNYAPRSA